MLKKIDKQTAIAYLGSLLLEDMCNRNPACSAAGNKFQMQFLDALRKVSGVSPTIISVLPIGTFPKSRKVFIPPRKLIFQNGLKGCLIPYVNVLLLKQLTVGLVNLLFLINWLWQQRGAYRSVLVYNVNSPMSIPVLLAVRLVGGKTFAVVSDFPHNLSFNFQGWKGISQRFNVWLEKKTLSYFTGIIAFTKYVGEDFVPERPILVMNGGVDPADISPVSSDHEVVSSEKICFFSGELSDINGIELLLKAFRIITDSSYKLWIFGRGQLEGEVRAAAKEDARIVYRGFLPSENILRYQKQATLMLNPRPTNQLITRYTFPSKLHDYMLSGKPVLTTALPGIPAEYFDFVEVLSDETPEGLARLITSICEKPTLELDAFGRRAREFILQTKNWSIQGMRIYEFICKLQ